VLRDRRIFPWSWGAFQWFLGLSIFSCLLITKDEWVHATHCSPTELWLHSILFILHPLALIATAVLWFSASSQQIQGDPFMPQSLLPDPLWSATVLLAQFGILTAFGIYQVLYWNYWRIDSMKPPSDINNACYHALGDRWYQAEDDPVALLRAESRLRNPWLLEEIQKQFGPGSQTVLDVACGAGFLSNALAKAGLSVTGIDLSVESLEVARRLDSTSQVRYLEMDARKLSFPDASFDVVCAMDFLEHVEHPELLIQEMARVLKPGGLFFFHTFDRNPLSWLIVIKGVEWFVKNTPKNLHVYPLFIKPSELSRFCNAAGLKVMKMQGTRPKVLHLAFWRMIWTGRVSSNFEFVFTSSLWMGYSGVAGKLRIPSCNYLR
jgi:2-polyprenyl-6-hydroxyphenyl methylase/3-demethylubiquinone-9 3-methyltransferase